MPTEVDKTKTRDALISYAHSDRDSAIQIKDALEAHRLTVWIDYVDIPPGAEFITEIEKGISISRSVLLLISEKSKDSKWVTQEGHQAFRLAMDGSCQVIPVLLDGTLPPGFLGNLQGVDFKEQPTFDSAIAHLVWGITGNKITASAKSSLKVVTDPRFLDSCLFMWCLSSQPLRSFGWNCDLQPVEWRSVPERLASSANSIGFYNRRVLLTYEGQRLYDLSVWSDLCIYRGYALLARGKGQSVQLSLAEGRQMLADLKVEAKSQGRKPTIMCMGADSVWILRTPLTPELSSGEFEIQEFNNPDLGLETFLRGFGDLYIGGLPQRLLARERGCIEVLSSQSNALLFSVNSLICSKDLVGTDTRVLSAVTSLWYDTLARLESDAAFRDEVAEACIALLSDLKIEGHHLTLEAFRHVLGQAPGRYEAFPPKPAGIVDELLQTLGALNQQAAALQMSREDMALAFIQLADILNPTLQQRDLRL